MSETLTIGEIKVKCSNLVCCISPLYLCSIISTPSTLYLFQENRKVSLFINIVVLNLENENILYYYHGCDSNVKTVFCFHGKGVLFGYFPKRKRSSVCC